MAGRTLDERRTYLGQMARRYRGAAVAVAHTLFVTAYSLLLRKHDYHDFDPAASRA